MLSDTAIRRAKPKPKPRKLFDAQGLYVIVTPTGGKWWRLKYRFAGVEKLLALGTYPEVPLKDARERRDEARRKIAAGIDPGAEKQAARVARAALTSGSFEAVAREWHE